MDGLQYPSGGLSAEGIEDTYWRDVRTGDWFVGFSGDGVIYDGKVWDVVSREERRDGRGQW